jgi:hypothetical protein
LLKGTHPLRGPADLRHHPLIHDVSMAFESTFPTWRMMAADVEDLCGRRHARSPDRRGHRWGRTRGKIGYQGGKVEIVRPRVRGADGEEMSLPSWTAAGTSLLRRNRRSRQRSALVPHRC